MGTPIKELCIRICSGGTPKSTYAPYYDGGIPWLNTKEIDFNFINSTERTISLEGLENSSAKWVEAPAVIVAMYGATAGKSAISNIRLTTNQACCNLNINPTLADYRFVYYSLKNDYIRLCSLANGGAQQNLNAQQIKDFEVPTFTLEIQNKIAAILSSLDDKIETNRETNARLEELAAAIFKSWFIDFEPFADGEFIEDEHGRRPKGWERTTLGNICKCILGGTPDRTKSSYWNGDIPWINSGEVNKFRIIKPTEFISEDGLNKSSTKLLPRKTTVLAITGATLGQVSLIEIDCCANQSVIGIIQNTVIPYTYIYPFIKSQISLLLTHQTGGAQQHVNKQNVENIPIIIPSKVIMEKYHNIVSPILDKIADNSFESDKLASLRDTLLPRLMSGELIPE